MSARNVFMLPLGAPAGGKEGCSGDLVLDIQRNDCGSWSTPCSMDLTINCEARGCWWSTLVTGPVTAETFAEANRLHGRDTLWPEALVTSSRTDKRPHPDVTATSAQQPGGTS